MYHHTQFKNNDGSKMTQEKKNMTYGHTWTSRTILLAAHSESMKESYVKLVRHSHKKAV